MSAQDKPGNPAAGAEKATGLRPVINAGCLGHPDIVYRLCATACSASAIFFNQENVQVMRPYRF